MTAKSLATLGGPPVFREPIVHRWPVIPEEDVADVADLLRRAEISYNGREGEVRRLEDEVRDQLGVRYALATSSGTAALHSAYFGLGLRAGDELLAPTFTFLSTALPAFVCNAVPVLVDADPATGNIDPADIEHRVTPRTKAIVVTHLAGHSCDMAPILDVARRHGLAVVEDAAQAQGGSYESAPLGSIGDVGIFSFERKKLVPGGEGGMLVTNRQDVYERACLLGHFRERCEEELRDPRLVPYAGTGFGLNYRMHPVAALLARKQLGRLAAVVEAREQRLRRLSDLLREVPGIEPPTVRDYVTRHAWYSYLPLYRGDELGGLPTELFVRAVQDEGVPLARPKSPPLHLEAIFQAPEDAMFTAPGVRRPVYRAGDFPASERYAARVLRLPAFTAPESDGWLDGIAEAFAKVAAAADELRDRAGSLAGADSVR